MFMEEQVTQGNDQEHMEAPPEIVGSASTRIRYTLQLAGAPGLGQLVSVAVATATYTVFSYLSLLVPSPIPSVSVLFFAIGFGVPFALWFGGWALVIGYIGNFLGAGLLAPSPLPLPLALLFGTTDLIQLGLPMIMYRLLASRFGVSPIGKDVFTIRGFIFFTLYAVLPGNILGGLYGNFLLLITNQLPPDAFLFSWFTWSLSNIVFTLVIGSVLLSTLGSLVERFGITIPHALN
jgi:hypothetical protein